MTTGTGLRYTGPGTSTSNDPSLSADGRRVGFYWTASNLVASDTNSRGDVFLRDLAAATTVRKSLTQNGAQANEASSDPWLASDGATIAFDSVATNLIPEDTDATKDVYVRGPGSDASAYAYDRLSRLTSATEPGLGVTTYTYDPAGNRLTRVRGGTSTAYAYDRADRITAAGLTAITVSAVGTTTAKGTDAFAYDQANRLRTATVAGTSETSVYDGDGVRFSRQVGAGPVTRYVTDPAAGLPVTIDDGSRKYVWGLGLAYAVPGSMLEVYHADRLGSTRALTDASGAVTATYRTDEFGVPATVTGTSSQPFRYTGEPLDASGLTYLRARYYDPSLGRFMSRDPFPGFPASTLSLNRYTYVENNPTARVDPSGLRSVTPPRVIDPAKARVLRERSVRRLIEAIGAGAKCGYATYVVAGEVTYGVVAGVALGTSVLAFASGLIPLGGVAAVGGVSAIGIYLYNVEYTQQVVAYCLGQRGVPDAPNTFDVVSPFIPPFVPPAVPAPQSR